MHVRFTEEELAVIDRRPFAWRVREGSDPKVAASAERKLEAIRTQRVGPDRRGGGNAR